MNRAERHSFDDAACGMQREGGSRRFDTARHVAGGYCDADQNFLPRMIGVGVSVAIQNAVEHAVDNLDIHNAVAENFRHLSVRNFHDGSPPAEAGYSASIARQIYGRKLKAFRTAKPASLSLYRYGTRISRFEITRRAA